MEGERDAEMALGNLTLTDNCSLTHITTESECLNFSFDVLQNTSEEVAIEKAAKSWEENPSLTLKLIFQLRDIRQGKGAQKIFHHCLLWMANQHPETLFHNLEHLPRHGYWKDLCWLVSFLITGTVNFQAARQVKRKDRNPVNDFSRFRSFDEVVQAAVDGLHGRRFWKNYLKSLPSDDQRREAKVNFLRIASRIHKQKRQSAKEQRREKKRNDRTRLDHLLSSNAYFSRVYNKVVDLFVVALIHDTKEVETHHKLAKSLLAGKWAPTINGSIDRMTRLGKAIALKLYSVVNTVDIHSIQEEQRLQAYAAYRKKYLNVLRGTISIPERFMSSNRWDQLPYERVPSVCMKRNKTHFLKHDFQRFQHYVEQVAAGKKKIASGALLPHEIIAQINSLSDEDTEMIQVVEAQWKSYVDNLKQSGVLKSALAICDVSGSMSGLPMEVAIALSLLIAEVSSPPFNNVVCTFSEKPQLHSLNQPKLRDKIKFLQSMEWGANTNLQAVFDILLGLAESVSLSKDDMVKSLYIFSDMEFDSCGGQNYETDYQVIARKYRESSYPLPSIVFWNLRGGRRSKPVTSKVENVALVSGFSGQLMKCFLRQESSISNPFQMMLDMLGSNYDHLEVKD